MVVDVSLVIVDESVDEVVTDSVVVVADVVDGGVTSVEVAAEIRLSVEVVVPSVVEVLVGITAVGVVEVEVEVEVVPVVVEVGVGGGVDVSAKIGSPE